MVSASNKIKLNVNIFMKVFAGLKAELSFRYVFDLRTSDSDGFNHPNQMEIFQGYS
jgi:hypothetical protein